MNLSRREFLSKAATTGGALSLGAMIHGCQSAGDPAPEAADGAATWAPAPLPSALPKDVVIERVSLVVVRSRRPKFIGKNAEKGDHGEWIDDNCLRLITNAGQRALGTGDRVTPEMARPLVGKSLADLCDPQNGFPEEFRRMDLALWDLLGQVTGRPIWTLMGGAGPREVTTYDGSFYLSDLIHPDKGAAQLAEEIERSLAMGYRDFKLKIGRGHKWLTPWEKGFARDIEVIRAARRAAGPECRVLVDANNGYAVTGPDGKSVDYDASLARVAALLDAAGDQNLLFVEEMFPENVEGYRRLHEEIRKRGLKTVVADGENFGRIAQAEPYLPGHLIDVLQPDIRFWGLTLWRRLAGLAMPHGVRCTPHNWGSRIGLYASLQLARGIGGGGSAEDDIGTNDLYDTDGWTLKDGRTTVPDDRPGLGFAIREDVYKEKYAGKEEWSVGRF